MIAFFLGMSYGKVDILLTLLTCVLSYSNPVTFYILLEVVQIVVELQ